MQDKLARMQEIANRGLQDKIPAEKRQIFDEAVRRGLVKLPTAQDQPAQEQTLAQKASPYVRPVLEGAGAALGGIAGTGLGPVGTVAGAGLGYASGKRGADIYDELVGLRQPQPLAETAIETAKDIGTGAALEMGGQAIGPVVSGIGRGVASAGREALGMMTGAGPEAISQAAKGTAGFAKGLRGGSSADEIVDATKGALGDIKGQRAAAYTEKLATIPKTLKINKQPVNSAAAKVLKDFGIGAQVNGQTGELMLDFSRSSVTDKAAQGRVEEMIQDVYQWGRNADDLTPMGMDLLKRRLQDRYTAAGPNNANSISTRLYKTVKQSIVDQVPQYAGMVKDYEKATNFITEAERALSLGDRAMMDTTFKKLLSTQRENFEFRRELLQRMEEQAGRSLSPEIAGMSMNQWLPKGLVGKLSAGGAGGVAATSGITPGVAAYLAISSPRVAGEVLHNVIGVPRREVGKILASREFQKFSGAVRAAQKAATRGVPMSQVNQEE